MRLLRDHNPGAYAVRVRCLVGGEWVNLSDAVIDADGPAFQAYYCTAHAPDGLIARCTRRDCTRGN